MKIFLSYASQDRAVAESIAFSLRGRGHKVFLDRDNLPPGGSYDQQIESAVNDSDVFVFLVSPDSVAHGRYSLTELTFARRKWQDPNGRVLPVVVRNTPLEDVPPYLRAVSLLEPIGNIAAETSSAVDNMRPTKRRSDEVSPQYPNALGLGIVALVTFLFIGVAVEHPIVKGWDILGLAAPFYIAIITYAVFSWLDSNASDEATEVISSWLHGRSQHKPDLGNLIINAFDRIYTSPLLTFRAFRRSAAISTIIYVLLFDIPFAVADIPKEVVFASETTFSLGLLLPTTVVLDYISLFFVRNLLVRARLYPISASILSFILGITVVVVSFSVVALPGLARVYFHDQTITISMVNKEITTTAFEAIKSMFLPLFFLITRPTLIIHLWLPLFALSSLVARLIFWIFRAVEWAQWFLKQGDAHPLKAIGIVATIIVFGSAMLVKEAWTVL